MNGCMFGCIIRITAGVYHKLINIRFFFSFVRSRWHFIFFSSFSFEFEVKRMDVSGASDCVDKERHRTLEN